MVLILIPFVVSVPDIYAEHEITGNVADWEAHRIQCDNVSGNDVPDCSTFKNCGGSDLSNPPCDEKYHKGKRVNDIRANETNLQYGGFFRVYGHVIERSDGPVTISIYNPCGKIAAQLIAQVEKDYAASYRSEVYATGTDWNISGIYTIKATSSGGKSLAQSTISVQSTSAVATSPSSDVCIKESGGGVSSTGETLPGYWKGKVSGFGTWSTGYEEKLNRSYLYYKISNWDWTVTDGIFEFEINNDGTITGTGGAGVLPHLVWGNVDTGKVSWLYKCESRNNTPISLEFKVLGNTVGDQVRLYLKDGNPTKMEMELWCNDGRKFKTSPDPFVFNDSVYLDLKKGATGKVTVAGPWTGGTMKWSFAITQEGSIPSKSSSSSSSSTSTPKTQTLQSRIISEVTYDSVQVFSGVEYDNFGISFKTSSNEKNPIRVWVTFSGSAASWVTPQKLNYGLISPGQTGKVDFTVKVPNVSGKYDLILNTECGSAYEILTCDVKRIVTLTVIEKPGTSTSTPSQTFTPSVTVPKTPSTIVPQDRGSFTISDTSVEVKRYSSKIINISGNVEDYKRGTVVEIIISKPDGETEAMGITPTKKGHFSLPLNIDDTWASGKYSVEIRYDGVLGIKSFDVKHVQSSLSVTTPTEPIFRTIPSPPEAGSREPLRIGMGPFDELLGTKLDKVSISLIILISTSSDGELTIVLPRSVLDAKKPNGQDDEFLVLVDSNEVRFNESKTSTHRTLTVPFGIFVDEIEIIGTQVGSLKSTTQESKSPVITAAKEKVPNWVKNNAKWWATGEIDEKEFVNGIQYMINEKIINVPNLPTQSITTQTITPKSGSATPGCEKTSSGCYIPSTATIDVGGVVIFSNTDNAAHTFTAGNPIDGPSGEFDTSFLTPGDSFEWTPHSVGEVPYFDMLHPWMEGLIIVQTTQASSTAKEKIPDWIKRSTGWWADGLISENDFVKGLEYLVEKGIVRVK